MTGAVTAYCGPVAFLGILAPHLARSVFTTANHRTLLPATLLLGAPIAATADLVAHLPWSKHFLHLNEPPYSDTSPGGPLRALDSDEKLNDLTSSLEDLKTTVEELQIDSPADVDSSSLERVKNALEDALDATDELEEHQEEASAPEPKE
jgi:hypothetical protein